MTRSLFFALLMGLLLLACASESGPAPTDGDPDPDGYDIPLLDGDADPDADRDAPLDGDAGERSDAIEAEREAQRCNPDDQDYCRDNRRWFCNSEFFWEAEDCAPGVCMAQANDVFCLYDQDGDLERDADPDAEPDADPEAEMEPEADADAESETETETEQEAQPVIHQCATNDQRLGPPCADDADCPDVCEQYVGAGCWACTPDTTCAPADPGAGSCFEGDGDLDMEPEPEPEMECSLLDPWTCEGHVLHYCSGGEWATIDCAEQDKTCIEDGASATCGGTLEDGDLSEG